MSFVYADDHNRSAKSEFSWVSSIGGMILDDHLPIQAHSFGRIDRGPEFIVERPVVFVQPDFAGDADLAASLRALGASRLRIGAHSRRRALASSAIGDRFDATSR